MIKTKAKKIDKYYKGYIVVPYGGISNDSYNIWSQILHLTKKDALDEANFLLDDFKILNNMIQKKYE